MNNQSLAHYSVVQYCGDRRRMERVNVGIVVYSNKHQYLSVKVDKNLRRVTRVFGIEVDELKALKRMLAMFAGRYNGLTKEFGTLESLNEHAELRANMFSLSQFKPVFVDDPSKKLDELFAEMVEYHGKRVERGSISSEFEELIEKEKLGDRVKKDVDVYIDAFSETESFPFAYQNGTLKLVKPENLSHGSWLSARGRASSLAVGGKSIAESSGSEGGKMQLVAVLKLPSNSKHSESVHKLLTEHKVVVYEWKNVDVLIRDIRQNAHSIDTF